MSAIGGPDEHSHREQYPEASQQHSNPTDRESGYDQNYEPEREFVLMPLFRRIGEMLGLRRNQEPEYIYESEHPAPQQPVLRTIEPQDEVVLPETAIQYSEPQLPAENPPMILSAPVLNDEHRHDQSEEQTEEDVLQLNSAPAQIADNSDYEPAGQVYEEHVQPVGIEQPRHSISEPSFSEESDEEHFATPYSDAPEMERASSAVEDWPIPPQPASTTPAPSRRRSADEVRQLVAPLREAAVKITAIVSQAAEWLRTKEEEFLRSAESIAAESKLEQESLRSSSPQLESPTDSPASSTPQETEVPGVQRELAWREKSERPAAYIEPLPAPIQFVAKPDRPMTAPSVPFWKRVNWAEEFTPKRVAFLGGLGMAVLLVLGISLARRPASSVLPEQQTRSFEPGGVTVTTHPAAAPVPPQVLRKAAATERPSPVTQHRPHRAKAEAYDDEPDVVIHHYDTAKKPSPLKQTNVAGVRHYSDM